MCLWWCGCLWLGLDLVGGRASQTLCARLTHLGSSQSVTSVLHRQHQWSSTLLLVQLLLLLSTTLSSTTLTALNLSTAAFDYSSENGHQEFRVEPKQMRKCALQITMATHQSTHQIFLFESFCLCLLPCCLAFIAIARNQKWARKMYEAFEIKIVIDLCSWVVLTFGLEILSPSKFDSVC